MTEPWFNPNAWAWLPATLFGCLGGVWGSVAGVCAPRGKLHSIVLGSALLLLAASLAMLAVGAVAWGTGQPFGVWVAFLFPGIQGPLILGPLLPMIRLRYRQAEERKLQAEDLG